MNREAKLKIGKSIALLILIAFVFFCGRSSANIEPDPPAPTDLAFVENTDSAEAEEVAMRYLDAAPYSKEGLAEALTEYEHFEKSTAQKAVESIGADWQEQAEKAVALHLHSDGVSEKQLRQYLQRDLFTDEQIDASIKNVSPDWLEQASRRKECLLMAGVNEMSIPVTLLTMGFGPEIIERLD